MPRETRIRVSAQLHVSVHKGIGEFDRSLDKSLQDLGRPISAVGSLRSARHSGTRLTDAMEELADL